MYSTQTLSCPLCGNSWKFVTTYHYEPRFASCEKCGFDAVLGYTARNQIEHRRPKLLPDADYYGSSDHE